MIRKLLIDLTLCHLTGTSLASDDMEIRSIKGSPKSVECRRLEDSSKFSCAFKAAPSEKFLDPNREHGGHPVSYG